MNRYAEVVINAIKLIQEGRAASPSEAWNIEVAHVFGGKISSYNKTCTRNAFLGLCEEGFIQGVNKGPYTTSKVNKEYAIKARNFFFEKNLTDIEDSELWRVIGIMDKKHNLQLEVVKELYINKLLV